MWIRLELVLLVLRNSPLPCCLTFKRIRECTIAAIADPNPGKQTQLYSNTGCWSFRIWWFWRNAESFRIRWSYYLLSAHSVLPTCKTAFKRLSRITWKADGVFCRRSGRTYRASKEKKCMLQISYQRHYQPEFIILKADRRKSNQEFYYVNASLSGLDFIHQQEHGGKSQLCQRGYAVWFGKSYFRCHSMDYRTYPDRIQIIYPSARYRGRYRFIYNCQNTHKM